MINEEKHRDRWYKSQQMLWQTRTIASYIAAQRPYPEGQKNELLEQAQSIGEGTLVESKGKKEDDEELYLGLHKFNSYEHAMSIFGGNGSVQLTRAG